MKPETKQAREVKRVVETSTAEALRVFGQTPEYTWGRIRDIEAGKEHSAEPVPAGHFRIIGHAIFWNKKEKEDEKEVGWADFPCTKSGVSEALLWIASFFASARKQNADTEYLDYDYEIALAQIEAERKRIDDLRAEVPGWTPPPDAPVNPRGKKPFVIYTVRPAKDEELYFNPYHRSVGIKAKNKYATEEAGGSIIKDTLYTMGFLSRAEADDPWIEPRGSGQTIPPKGAAPFGTQADSRNDKAKGGQGRRAREKGKGT
jgi:hypothetical protein